MEYENLEVVVRSDAKEPVLKKIAAVIDSLEPEPIVGTNANFPDAEVLVYKRVRNGPEVVVAAMANGASIVTRI